MPRLLLPVTLLGIFLNFCAPKLGLAPNDDPHTQTNCVMKVVNRHTQDGSLCRGDFVGTGVVSLSPMKIQCAEVDWECP